MQLDELTARIRRLEDREAIRELVGRYCRVVDDRDVEGISDCFTEQGGFRSRDGVLAARGRAAVLEQFHGRFAVLGPSNHFNHDHAIWFDDTDPDLAFGLVSAHAEVVRNGAPMWAALRYEDAYRRDEDGRWRFEDRLLSFFYYLEVGEYPRLLGARERMRAYETPAEADYPEKLASWKQYYRTE
jgi:ketosteroid isomerase-like protein